MEIILVSLIIVAGIFGGIFVGERFGLEKGMDIGYEEGLRDGFMQAKEDNAPESFPLTLDGNFYSTNAALRTMSVKRGDD